MSQVSNASGLESGLGRITAEMVAGWDTLPPPSDFPLEDWTRGELADVEAVAVIHGWMARIMRTGELVQVGLSAGYTTEVSPLVRSMIEHAMGLWWIVDQRGAAFQALVRGRGDAFRRVQAAQEQGWNLGFEDAQELLQAAIDIDTDEETRTQDRLLHIAAQGREYALGILYQAWLIESWSSHASLISAQPYYSVDPSDALSIRLHRVPEGSAIPVMAAVASIVHYSLTAYVRLLPGEPLSEELRAWAERFEELAGELETP